MKLLSFSILACALLPTLTYSSRLANDAVQLNSILSRATKDILTQLQKEEIALAKKGIKATCTVKNIAIRKELYVSIFESLFM